MHTHKQSLTVELLSASARSLCVESLSQFGQRSDCDFIISCLRRCKAGGGGGVKGQRRSSE